MPYTEKQKNIDRFSILLRFDGPLQLRHAGMADNRFFALYAVDPKYCVFPVDLFTFKFYMYRMKNRLLLKRKLGQFYTDLEPKKKNLDPVIMA